MDNYAVPQIQDENGQLMLGDYGPDSREAMRFDSDEDANYFAENYKDVSPGFLNQKKKGGASGCPKGEYWNGTKCVKIPKNTRIVYHTDKDVYDKAFAAESDSSHFYNNAKSDFNKVRALQSRIRTSVGDAAQDKARDAYHKERDRQEKKWYTDNYKDSNVGVTINHKYKGPKSGLKIKPVGLEIEMDGYAFPRFKKPVVHNVYEEPIKEEEFIPMPIKKPELISTTTGDIIGQSEQLLAPEYSANYPENRIGYDKYNWYTTKSGLPKRKPNTGGFYKKASKKVKDLQNYMEGYEDEDGNYIPGEIEKAKQEGRQIKFKGNISKTDKEAQETYNKEYDEYENLKNYQNQIMNLMQYKLNKKQFGGLHKFPGGGSSSCPKDHVWDSNTKKCVKVYTLANNKKLIDGVSNWAMQSNDRDKITPEYNDQIKHYLYSGAYGYDPITGTLHKLPKEQKTVADAETKKILAKQDDNAAYRQSIIDAGFDPETFGKSKGTNVITGEEIYGDKSQEDVDKINKEAVNDFVTEGHKKTILDSPFNLAAFFTPPGMAAGVMQGAVNLLPDIYDFGKDPSWSTAGAVGMDALMMLPAAKGIGKFLGAESKALSNVDDVKLITNPTRSQQLDGEAFSIYKGNKNVGEISGTRSSNGDFIVSDVGVDAQFQKQGIGTQAYKQLNQSLSPGNKVKSWGAFVEDAGVAPGRNTWQGLEKQGLAKVNEKGIYEMLPEVTSPPKSEINWGKWNKEILENKPLMQEYNAIEETSKANGTWMKNSDGTPFNGTPEQFVQQQSQNFKNAFPDYYGETLTTRSNNQFDTFDESKFGTTDEGWYGKGIYTFPTEQAKQKGLGTMYGSNEYDLYVNSANKGFVEEPLVEAAEMYQKNTDQLFNDLKAHNEDYIKKYGSNDLTERLVKESYDDLLKKIKAGEENNINQYTTLTVPSSANETIIPFSNRVKSAKNNNGMFDMANPNIYKALIPAIGVGAASQIPQNKYGGSSGYKIGDEIDEDTMRKLKKLGYKLQKL